MVYCWQFTPFFFCFVFDLRMLQSVTGGIERVGTRIGLFDVPHELMIVIAYS